MTDNMKNIKVPEYLMWFVVYMIFIILLGDYHNHWSWWIAKWSAVPLLIHITLKGIEKIYEN